MKKSNRLIVTAIVITLLSLLAYDILLKAAYRSGEYKNPNRNFTALNYKDFDIVDINSSTAANVKFVQGPFSVMMDNYADDYVKISQHGNRLQVDANFEGDYRSNQSPYLLVISCPLLRQVNAGATYLTYGRPYTDTTVKETWNMREILISGFKQDSISIVQDYGSTVVLDSTQFRSISAVTGISAGSGSKLVLLNTNRFENTRLDIRQHSKLIVHNATINRLDYMLADSAQLIISGNAQHLLKNSNIVNR